MKHALWATWFAALSVAACSPPRLPGPISVSSPTALDNSPTSSIAGAVAPTQSPLPSTPTIQSNADATLAPTRAIPNASPSSQAAARPGATSTIAPSGIIGSKKTYVNARLQIALDYPGDWSVRETANGAIFTSPQGMSIDLSEINANNPDLRKFEPDEDLPNARCTNSTNPHKVDIRKCLDTIARSYTAYLTLRPVAAGTRVVTLSTRAIVNDAVFDVMLASARIAP